MMTKSANEVMHDIIAAAVIDAVMALRTASGGLPNTMLRDLNAIHANTTYADLPKDVQAAIVTSTRAAFTRLLREGYSVTSGSAPPPRPRPPRPELAGDRQSQPRPRPGPGPRPRSGEPRSRPGGKPPGGGKPRPR